MSANQQKRRFWRRRLRLPGDAPLWRGVIDVLYGLLWLAVALAMWAALMRSAGAQETEQHGAWGMGHGVTETLNSEALTSADRSVRAPVLPWPLWLTLVVMTVMVVWTARRQRREDVELAEAYAGEDPFAGDKCWEDFRQQNDRQQNVEKREVRS